MLVHDFLQLSAERVPDKVALVCNRRRVTYAELDTLANRLAHGFASHGVARGDRVVVHLENSVEAVASIFAVLKAGAVCVPVNPKTKPVKLAYILNNCQAAALVTGARSDVAGLWAGVPSLRLAVVAGDASDADVPRSSRCLSFAGIQDQFPGSRPPEQCIDVDLALLIYTSGSTGHPKGVMCDHSNVVFAARSIMSYLGSREDDVVIGVLPLSFDYGLYQLFMTLACAGTLVLEQSFTYPAEVLQRIEQEKVTGLPGVPSLFAMLLQMDLSSVRSPQPSLRHQHGSRPADESHPGAAQEAPVGDPLLDVWPHGNQAHALSAPRSTRPAPRIRRHCHSRNRGVDRGPGGKARRPRRGR